MGVITSKASNPTITDKSNPRYTPLNDFDKMGLKTIVGGQDAILGGINVIGRQEVQIKAYLVASAGSGERAEVGDTILIAGNRKGIITKAVYSGNDVVLRLKVHEVDIPQRNAATPADLTGDNMVGQSGRTTEYIFGIETATGTTSKLISGATTHTLILGTPTVLKKKTLDPATWNPIAQAMRKYQGVVSVTITVNGFTDAGTTPAVGVVTFTPIGSGSVVVATMIAGTITAVLESEISYNVTDGDGSVSEVQESGNGTFTPTISSLVCTIHNYIA